MRVLLVELLGFIPARFSVDIGSKTGYGTAALAP